LATNQNNSGVDTRQTVEKAAKRLTELCEQAIRTGITGMVSVEVHFRDGVASNLRRLMNVAEK
jgi:hypothetical protein